MKANQICRKCGVKLADKNWAPSFQRAHTYLCKGCQNERNRLWRKANPERHKAIWTRSDRKKGHRPFDENRECAQFIGIHIAERVLSRVFKDVKRMPMNNPGYDVICNRDKLIDIKSSCKRKDGSWDFHIERNTIADYFLCLAFDNREDLNPLHAWLLPGSKFNHFKHIGISPSTIQKWDEYKLDLTKINECCDTMRTSI